MIENDNSGKISRRNSFNTNRKKDKSDAAAQQAYILNWLKDKYLELEALKENEDVDNTGLNINNINIRAANPSINEDMLKSLSEFK